MTEEWAWQKQSKRQWLLSRGAQRLLVRKHKQGLNYLFTAVDVYTGAAVGPVCRHLRQLRKFLRANA